MLLLTLKVNAASWAEKKYKTKHDWMRMVTHWELSKKLKHCYADKKRNCQLVDFAISVVHRMKLKESKKTDKYQNLTGVLKKLWNIKWTVISIVVGALGAIPKVLEKKLEELMGDQRKKWDHLEHSTSKISEDT